MYMISLKVTDIIFKMGIYYLYNFIFFIPGYHECFKGITIPAMCVYVYL